MIGLAHLVAALRQLRCHVAEDEDPVIVIPRGHRRFAWHAIEGCGDGGMPGLPAGQSSDCRVSTDHPDGLHLHRFPDRIEAHLDRADPLKSAPAHLLNDTKLLPGLMVGAAVGLAIAALGGGRGIVLAAPVLGAFAGGFAPARKPRRWMLDDLMAV